MIALLRTSKRRTTEVVENHDFSSLFVRGLSKDDLLMVVERLVFVQEMEKALGREEAITLRIGFSAVINTAYLGRIFPEVEYLQQCEGGVQSGLEEFLVAYATANKQKGIQEAEEISSTPGSIQAMISNTTA